MGDCKLKPGMVYHAENPRTLKGYDKSSLPVLWFFSSTSWMTVHIFQAYSKVQLVHELKEYYMSQGLPFHILMVLNNAPAHPQCVAGLALRHQVHLLPPNTMSLLQPMDQSVIQMFKTHYLRKTWHALSLKCDVSLGKPEKASASKDFRPPLVSVIVLFLYFKMSILFTIIIFVF